MEDLALSHPGFWQGRQVFVTGHNGFKGTWLSLWLTRLGARVTGFSLARPPSPTLFPPMETADGMATVVGDIRDLPSLEEAMREARPELVIHMAAQSLVRVSYADPVETFATNVMGTVNLLDAVRRCSSVRAVVVVTSDKCYENRGHAERYREDHAMGGFDPYSSSKGCAELVVSSYRRSFFASHGAAVASTRSGNVIGGGDWAPDRLVPDAFRAFFHGNVAAVRNPTAVRPWQHVLDPLQGYLDLASRLLEADPGRFAEGWNFGPDEEEDQSVAGLMNDLAEAWGPTAQWRPVETADGPHEAAVLRLDCTKAHTMLGWRPRYRRKQAVALTVDWYRAFERGEDMAAFTLRQIDEHLAAAEAPASDGMTP